MYFKNVTGIGDDPRTGKFALNKGRDYFFPKEANAVHIYHSKLVFGRLGDKKNATIKWEGILASYEGILFVGIKTNRGKFLDFRNLLERGYLILKISFPTGSIKIPSLIVIPPKS